MGVGAEPRGLPLLLAGLVFVALAYFHGGAGWNQNARLNAIFTFVEPGADSGTFRIDRFLDNTGDFAEHGGHHYANKAPGTILLGIPVYWLLYHVETGFGLDVASPVLAHVNAYLINLFVSVLLTALAVPAFYRILRWDGLSARLSAGLTLALFLGTAFFPYSTQLWGHTTTGALLILALGALLGVEDGSRRRRLLLAGFWGGWAVCTEYQAVLFVVLAGAFCLVEHRRDTVYYVAGGLLPLLLYGIYHQMCFGHPLAFASAYSNPVFLEAERSLGLFGAVSPSVLWQLLFSSYRGIFLQMPVLILAIPGLYFWFRRQPRSGLLWVALLTFLGFLVMNATFNGWWGGFTCVSRYLIPALPFLFLAVKELPWNRTWRLALVVLAGISAFNMLTVASVSPACHSELKNPIYDTTYERFFEGRMSENRTPIRLQGRQPGWQEASHWAAWNLGQRLGLQGLSSLLPLLLAAAVLGGVLARRLRAAEGAKSAGAGRSRMSGDRHRLLILVIAYNAQETLAEVINSIDLGPGRFQVPDGGEVPDWDVHGLIIDDASRDRTFDIGLELQARSKIPLRVLQNPAPLGYGGIQKLGFHYAIENGFQAVALLHGDGRYAPEKLAELSARVLDGSADAAFGSRLLPESPAAAASGDVLPLYKRLAGRVLCAVQNRLLGQDLSEYHCGYRVYSVDALKRIPFEYNTGDFHFDTEVIVQLTDGGMRIAEVPIPPYSSTEIGPVNGLPYVLKVLSSCAAYWLHRRGIFYRYNFDVESPETVYGFKPGYLSSHTRAIQAVTPGSVVVDVACSTGYVAEYLHREKRCGVFGIDLLENSSPALEAYFQVDLNSGELPECLAEADFVLMLDVVEHLADPERFLFRVRQRVRPGRARLVITVPNIGFVVTRLMLLFGQFNYGKRGILDKTHTRLFTFASLARLLRQSGFVVHRLEGIPAPFPKALGDHFASRFLLMLNRLGIALWKRLFSYQIYAEVTALATVESLAGETERHSREIRRQGC